MPAASPARGFDLYDDAALCDTLRLRGGTDQLALNNLRNIYAIRADASRDLRAYMAPWTLPLRTRRATSSGACTSSWLAASSLTMLGLSHFFELRLFVRSSGRRSLPEHSGLDPDMCFIWAEWLDLRDRRKDAASCRKKRRSPSFDARGSFNFLCTSSAPPPMLLNFGKLAPPARDRAMARAPRHKVA